MELQKGDALIVVDVQNDFLPGGALGVPNGDEVIPVLNSYIEKFSKKELPIFVTRDWHPEKHCSFVEQGGAWPPHCIADTEGAKFAPNLNIPKKAHIVSKAVYADNDAYSGFSGTNMHSFLTDMGIKRVFVGGLATDYCVKATISDAHVAHGYKTFYLQDASRGVNLDPSDVKTAELAMHNSGVITVTLQDIE
jgi:nicotinamidase-related amidase